MGMRVILLLYLCAGAGRVQAEAEGLPSTADAIALTSSIEHSMAAGAGAATARLGEPRRTRRTRRAAAADQPRPSPRHMDASPPYICQRPTKHGLRVRRCRPRSGPRALPARDCPRCDLPLARASQLVRQDASFATSAHARAACLRPHQQALARAKLVEVPWLLDQLGGQPT